jgi:hypothetical protein
VLYYSLEINYYGCIRPSIVISCLPGLIFLSKKCHFYQEFHEDENFVTKTASISTAIYSHCYGNKVASSSVSDVDLYVIIKKVNRLNFPYSFGIRKPVGNSYTLNWNFLA